MDPIIKKIQNSNRHTGRIGKILDSKIEKRQNKTDNKNVDNQEKLVNKENNKLENLQLELKEAIKDERYEEAAKIRDRIKEIEKNQN